jgi:hypothetical protein
LKSTNTCCAASHISNYSTIFVHSSCLLDTKHVQDKKREIQRDFSNEDVKEGEQYKDFRVILKWNLNK